jgi:hypothetical protein
MAKSNSTTIDLASGLGLAGLHSAITLWYRWPILAASCTPQGHFRHAPEIDRMIREKTAAAIEGLFNAQKELMRLTGAAMTGRLDAAALSDAASAIATAGLLPAFRVVKANSRRLSRRG